MVTVSVELPAVAILGAGSMTRAILGGLLHSGLDPASVTTTNRSSARAAELGALGVTARSEQDDPTANRAAVADAGIILIGVKPHQVTALLDDIGSAIQPGALVLSVAAGITTATMEQHLPESVHVIRSMPNTPALVGKAVTGLSAGSRSTEADLGTATALFETIGEVVVVPESQLDALSAISGSGPAYYFYFVEQLTRAAIARGFDPDAAERLAEGTFAGAAALLVTDGSGPIELRRRVTSPGGSTERAIAVFDEAGLADIVDRATAAALARAGEMASE